MSPILITAKPLSPKKALEEIKFSKGTHLNTQPQNKHHHTASSAHLKNKICTGNPNFKIFLTNSRGVSGDSLAVYKVPFASSISLHPPCEFLRM